MISQQLKRQVAVSSGYRPPAWLFGARACLIVAFVWLFLVPQGLAGRSEEPRAAADAEFFERRIRPVLVSKCYSCHSRRTSEPKAGLLLDSRIAIRRGGDSGPAVVPGDVEASLLVKALRHDGPAMPPKEKLPENVVRDFSIWIRSGAYDPREELSTQAATTDAGSAGGENWWSRRALAAAKPPTSAADQGAQPIDRFLLAALRQEGLSRSEPADRYSLLRRTHFVLTGLPPSGVEIESFISDRDPRAFERVVDRLLASPHFGERWARHWMDVVGYGESHGHEWNVDLRGAWRYRDYVVRALNADVPYDMFVREHIAGDLLEEPRWNESAAVNESRIGTAFFRFGEVDHDDCRKFPENNLDVIDHQIDTFSKAFQATTLACARCHDHKFDAVSLREYYALSGIFASSRQVVHTIDRPDLYDAQKRQLRALKPRIRSAIASLWRQEVAKVGRYLAAAQAKIDGAAAANGDLDSERLAKWVAALDTTRQKVDKKTKESDGARSSPQFDLFLLPWLEVVAVAQGERGATLVAAEVQLEEVSVAATWTRVGELYGSEQRQRSSFNESRFDLFADFRSGNTTAWDRSGLATSDGVSESVDFVVACDGDRVVHSILQPGFHTHRLSNRLNASLRSPLLPKEKRFVSFEVAGGRRAAWRNVYENCAVTNGASHPLSSTRFEWRTMETAAEEPFVPAFVEFVTKFDDYGYPGIFYDKRVDHDDIRSQFSVRRVVLHDDKEPPRVDLAYMLDLFDGTVPQTLADVGERYAKVLANAVDAWADGVATDRDAIWVDWMVQADLVPNHLDASAAVAELVARYRAVESSLGAPRLVAGVADFDRGFDVPLRVAGEAHQPGELVARGYVESITGTSATVLAPGSGRRELAEFVASPDNPLTARVFVNRVWQHVFGTGLVATSDDFGQLGERPSHPELLDYLARDFIENGWSLKKLVRSLLLTEAFQLSSRATRGNMEADAGNRLLHHYAVRRLEGEVIRDAMLTISRQLNRSLYGRSIHPFRLEERPTRKLFSGPLDANGRRSLYIRVTLTEEPPFLAVFNLPDPKHANGRRDVTNVPSQALTLLNDPFVLQQAGYWASRLVKDGSTNVRDRLGAVFLSGVGRLASPEEIDRFESMIAELLALYDTSPPDVMTDERLWRDVAHAVFNLKEFVYPR